MAKNKKFPQKFPDKEPEEVILMDEVSGTIEDWLNDFRASTPSNVMADDDDLTFEGSAANIMSRAGKALEISKEIIKEALILLEPRNDTHASLLRLRADRFLNE